MKCLGILWNSSSDYRNEMIDDIRNYAEVIGVVTLDLGDSYENFVRDMYDGDSIAKWKVDKKVETMFMCSSSRQITVLLMDVDTKEEYYHLHKKRNVYRKLEQMKIDIRDKYSKKVPAYFFDNVFHATDDEREFDITYHVIKKYMNIGRIIDANFDIECKVKEKEYGTKK